MATPLKHIGPHSRAFKRGAIGAAVDGRSRWGRYLRALEAQLVEQLGGEPTPAQRLLINRAARLSLQLELMDRDALDNDGALGPGNERRYLAWHNSLARTLKLLGLKPGKPARQPGAALADLVGAE
jgi:hypothetical protein